MKKFFVNVAFAVLAMTVMVSCESGDKKEVKATAENFLTALIAGDFNKTKEFTTVETQQKWDNFTSFISNQMSPEAKQAIASSVIQVTDVKVEGETAEAVCSAGIPYFSVQTTILHFKKVNGKWLVDEPNAIVTDVVTEKEIIMDVDAVNDSITADTTKVK